MTDPQEHLRHPENAYHTGEYSLTRVTQRGNGYWGQVCSEWVRTPLNEQHSETPVVTDENSEPMAASVVEMEALLGWKDSLTMKRIHKAFDDSDWDRVRAYHKHLTGPQKHSAAIDAAVDAFRFLGHERTAEMITTEHLLAADAIIAMTRTRTFNAQPTEAQIGALTAVAWDNPDDLPALIETLLERPEIISNPEEVRDLSAILKVTTGAVREGVL